MALPSPVAGQDPPPPETVGTIEMLVDGEKWVFDVLQGPSGEGFATGYTVAPRGEAMAVGTTLHGHHRASDAEVLLSVAFWQASGEHMCDPFANQLRFSPSDPRAPGRRLRPGPTPSQTCTPPPDGSPGGLAVHIDLGEGGWDEATGIVRVAGTFAGPLGRGDDALDVREGRFAATLRPTRRR